MIIKLNENKEYNKVFETRLEGMSESLDKIQEDIDELKDIYRARIKNYISDDEDYGENMEVKAFDRYVSDFQNITVSFQKDIHKKLMDLKRFFFM